MCVYPKNIALGQVVTNIVGHVDTVWDTEKVYTTTTLKSTYVTIYGIKHWDSKFNLSKSTMLPIIKRYYKKSFLGNYDLLSNQLISSGPYCHEMD